MNSAINVDEVLLRLARIESKMTRGFEEQGVKVQDDAGWFTVNHDAREVVVATLGRSVLSIRAAMLRAGCVPEADYALMWRDKRIGSVRV